MLGTREGDQSQQQAHFAAEAAAADEHQPVAQFRVCLLYTSDAADERSSVDLGGRRIIKKKKKEQQTEYAMPTQQAVRQDENTR